MGTVKVRDLSINDKIGLCAVAVLGREYAEAAFKLCRNIQTQNQNSLNALVSRWLNSDKAKEFIKNIKQVRGQQAAESNTNNLRTRDGIVSALIESTAATQGKDSISGLQTLAKLQGFDKPAEETSEKTRVNYFVPYVSNCRTCKLMELYREVLKENNNKNN